jgi:hypothetical protein
MSSFINEIITVISVLGIGTLLAFLGKSKFSKTQKKLSLKRILLLKLEWTMFQETLQEELDRIRSATTGSSPADDLADLGNARKRR